MQQGSESSAALANSSRAVEEGQHQTGDGSNPPASPGLLSPPSRNEFHTPHPEDLDDTATVVPLVDLPPPPDGGWGWVICFASFMCNLILDGIAYTFGVLLEPLVLSFDSNRSTVSWVGSLLAGVYLTSGPIVGGLVNKFGCRPVCMVGSVVACLGLVLSIFSPSVPVLMLTYGVIGGFGLGLIYLPAVVAVGYYFEERRALATGISVCGSGVGTFLFAPLATYLLEEFGWRGANLIFAGLCLNCAVFGALMRPLEVSARQLEVPPEENLDQDLQEFEDANPDHFTVRLPDGSHEVQTMRPLRPLPELAGSPTPTTAANSMQLPPLPTINEQSITKQEEEEKRKALAEVFKQERQQAPRRRTITEPSAPRFHVTPVRTSTHMKKSLLPQSITRNSSAPHFIDASMKLPRNSSTPGFGIMTLARQDSDSRGEHHQLVYGLQLLQSGSPALSNTTLHLQPQAAHFFPSSGRETPVFRPTVRPLYRKDIFYSGSVTHLANQEYARHHPASLSAHPSSSGMPNVTSVATMDEYRHSVLSIPTTSRRQSTLSVVHYQRPSIIASHLSLPPSIRKASALPDEFLDTDKGSPLWTALKEMLSIHLLKNKYFLLIGVSNIFGMLGFYVPFVYLPGMATLRGVHTEDANFLLSVIGISNTFGRVLAGWISDFAWVNSLSVTNSAILFSGLCVFVLPLCTSYASFVTIALAFGLFVAAYISLTSIVLVDLLGLDNLTSAFGLLVLFRGASSMIGPPLAGSVYDATESYDSSFYMAGAFLMVSAGISFVAQFLHARANTSAHEEEDKLEKLQEAPLTIKTVSKTIPDIEEEGDEPSESDSQNEDE